MDRLTQLTPQNLLLILFVTLAVQLFKAKPDWFWNHIPARLQPTVPVLIGLGYGIIDALVAGLGFTDAVIHSLVAAGLIGAGSIGTFEGTRRLLKGARGTVALLVLLTLSGCAGSLEAARQEQVLSGASPSDLSTRCQRLDDKRRVWSGIATGALALSGGSGLSTIPIGDDDRDARVTLAASSVVLAALAASAYGVEQSLTESWARECGAR